MSYYVLGQSGAVQHPLSPPERVREKTTHTPGPWVISRWQDADHQIWIDSEGKRGVAAALHFDPVLPSEEEQANAYLIAAAPDLLDACEEFLAALDSIQGMGTLTPEKLKEGKFVRGIMDAVAKAKGG